CALARPCRRSAGVQATNEAIGMPDFDRMFCGKLVGLGKRFRITVEIPRDSMCQLAALQQEKRVKRQNEFPSQHRMRSANALLIVARPPTPRGLLANWEKYRGSSVSALTNVTAVVAQDYFSPQKYTEPRMIIFIYHAVHQRC